MELTFLLELFIVIYWGNCTAVACPEAPLQKSTLKGRARSQENVPNKLVMIHRKATGRGKKNPV